MTKALLTRLDQCQEFCFKILSSFINSKAEAVAQNLNRAVACFEPVMLALEPPSRPPMRLWCDRPLKIPLMVGNCVVLGKNE